MQKEVGVLKFLFGVIAILTIYHLIHSYKSRRNDFHIKIQLVFAEWTPFKIDFSQKYDPTIYFCKLDFQSYHENPYRFPLFQDIVRKSGCHGNFIRRISYCSLKESFSEIQSSSNLSEGSTKEWRNPTGIIFHESRVGSTLLANVSHNVICIYCISSKKFKPTDSGK